MTDAMHGCVSIFAGLSAVDMTADSCDLTMQRQGLALPLIVWTGSWPALAGFEQRWFLFATAL